ncbi:hypothetical protein F5148DRAFT_977404 [Russula earlei]|uniref:Uncharacterized protein n=1 Tax=Russula earlei TaxID=71964 RepID=A0ACC0UG55_9AGAM|nr:hypothetical protein F5148DRAFT_977404 [Russula earlei]
MFFYLSFLRTPPHSMSNDLRTDPFPSNVDIFYWWISGTTQNLTKLSEPTKLTTWRRENAYKPMQIPPPSKSVVGASGIDCTLVLSTMPDVASSVIDLSDPEIGRVPLPVYSLPIRICPQRGHGAAAANMPSPLTGKQEAITRPFRLFGRDATAPLMQIKEAVSFDLDKKLWDSGIGLSAWLVRLSALDVSGLAASLSQPTIVHELKERLFSGRQGCHIIELGAGTGIVSLVLAALRSANLASSVPPDEPCSILSTDLRELARRLTLRTPPFVASSMELMSHNIRTNVMLYPHCPPTGLPLDWDEELPLTVRNFRDHGGFDIVVMADVTYNTSSFPALLRTLSSLLALSAHHRRDGARKDEREPLVLLAYKERDPAERQVWEMMARETGVMLECVGKHAGGGGLPVEIWLGRRR